MLGSEAGLLAPIERFKSVPSCTVFAGLRLASMGNLLQGVLVAGAGVTGSLLTALYVLQEKLIYHPGIPSREYVEKPTDYAMQYEDVELVADDGVKLHAWMIRQHNSVEAATFIYFHGNAGNLSHRLMDLRGFYGSGFNILAVSYRGFGASEGSPSERGFRRDARAAVEYCLDRTDVLAQDKIFIFGRSIGGAVAIAAAGEAGRGRVAGLVLENTFESMGGMIDVVLPPLRFVKAMNRNPWDSLSAIRVLKTPLLFISGLRDELVPPQHVKSLYDAAVNSDLRRFFTVDNGTHNDTWCVFYRVLPLCAFLSVFIVAWRTSDAPANLALSVFFLL